MEDFDRPYLIISDTQIPFEAPKALEFCAYLAKHYRIPEHNILNVGDETDQFHGSLYPKDGDFDHTPNSEIAEARYKLEKWFTTFPYMRLAISNHMLRWVKKAAASGFPSQLIRSYQELYRMPPGWVWADSWTIKTKHPFDIVHGMSFSGKTPYRGAAEKAMRSVAFGHLHSSAGMCRVKTNDKNIWAMNTGCLIDVPRYAFKYEKNNEFKPTLGAAVVFNKGSTPQWFPYEV